MKDRKECGSYRDIALMAHVSRMLLNIIAHRRSNYWEIMRILPEEQWFSTEPFNDRHGVRGPSTSGVDTEERNSTVRVLYQSQQWVRHRQPNIPVDSTRPLRRTAKGGFGHSSILRWYAGIRTSGRREYLGWFPGLCQGNVLAPLLFNAFFTAVSYVAFTRLTANIDIMDALMDLKGKTGTRKERGARKSARRRHNGVCYMPRPQSSRNRLNSSESRRWWS